MKKSSVLTVKTHVGRDLLQAAALFKSEASVAWEYVVNSLQYVDRGTAPRVLVRVVGKPAASISISDNGRGMTKGDLNHFFTMHAENLERRAGRSGRGKFGTGKSAAFAIASTLEVDTRRNGLRNVVRLDRDTIDNSNGEEIPVSTLVTNEKTAEPNGTMVTISGLLVPIDTPSIIAYIERHLQAFRNRSPEVAVNNHVCSIKEIAKADEWQFVPTGELRNALGDVTLNVFASRAPLPKEDQGVIVMAGTGNTVAVERGGITEKDFGNYLFGEIDARALETSDSKIAPYNATRSLELNPQHPVAGPLIAFIGAKLEFARKQLLARAKDARQTEQARRLAETANKIADLLNDDFRTLSQRLVDITAKASSKVATAARFGAAILGGEDDDLAIDGTQMIGTIKRTGQGNVGRGAKGRPAPQIPATGRSDPAGNSSVDPAGGSGSRRPRPGGGFSVEYRNLGADDDRSRYDESSLSILINLDHPVVSAALGDGSVEEVSFLRLSYEIAFSEYAMALGYEVLKFDPTTPPDDLLYEVRSSLNRISRAAASLYQS